MEEVRGEGRRERGKEGEKGGRGEGRDKGSAVSARVVPLMKLVASRAWPLLKVLRRQLRLSPPAVSLAEPASESRVWCQLLTFQLSGALKPSTVSGLSEEPTQVEGDAQDFTWESGLRVGPPWEEPSRGGPAVLPNTIAQARTNTKDEACNTKAHEC